LRDIETGKVMDFWNFEDEFLIVSFFSSLCSICKSGRRIETLKELDRRLREKGIKAKVILVFSEPYDKEDIENWEKQIKIPFEKYISEDIFTDEEKYITDTSLKVDPLTIVLNGEREVVFAEKLLMKEKKILELIELNVK
jgi:arsenate reductase-like glutaredoxin family protein